MTPEEKAKYNRELDDLEAQVGFDTFPSLERHKKRWQQKVSNLEQKITEAADTEEKERLRQKLVELNRIEKERALSLAQLHELNALPARTSWEWLPYYRE